MKTFLKNLIKKTSPYQSLNEITIFSDNLIHNFHTLQNLQPNHTIIPVLKSNAYGHGIQQVATILEKHTTHDQCPLIAVDSYPEYQIVHRHTSRDILLLGEQLPTNYHLYDPHRTHFAVGSFTNLQALIETEKKRNIHLFLNTGMNREGFQMHDINSLTTFLTKGTNITITGVMSHFANADCTDSSYNSTQVDTFKTIYNTIQKTYSFEPTHIHLNNSAGIVKNHDPFFTASRAGLAFYGYNPFEAYDEHHHRYNTLRPALRLTSTITSIQHLKKGDSISYGHRRTATEPATIANIPFGYNEGLPRSLTGKNFPIKYNHNYYPLIGTICMNISIFHTSPDTTLFDTVEIISPNPSAPNSLANLAQKVENISYAILVGLDRNIKRTIKKAHIKEGCRPITLAR